MRFVNLSAMAIYFYRVVCRHCQGEELLSRHEAQRRLQAHKKLRAGQDADESLLDELVPALLKQIPCRFCGKAGLEVVVQTDVGDWADQRRCLACGQAISPARLAAVPEAQMCTACQSAVERDQTPGPPVYCRRCGSLMQLKPRQIGGRTRYVWVCSSPEGCHYWTERAS